MRLTFEGFQWKSFLTHCHRHFIHKIILLPHFCQILSHQRTVYHFPGTNISNFIISKCTVNGYDISVFRIEFRSVQFLHKVPWGFVSIWHLFHELFCFNIWFDCLVWITQDPATPLMWDFLIHGTSSVWYLLNLFDASPFTNGQGYFLLHWKYACCFTTLREWLTFPISSQFLVLSWIL